MVKIITDITHHGDLIRNLVTRDLKIRYRGSVLGLLWTVLNPLFMAVIYIVFLRLLSRGIANQYANIVIGVFAWQFTMQCINSGMNCVTGNASLVKKVYFPRIILPLSVNLSSLVNFLLTLVVQWVLVAVILMVTDGGFLKLTTLWVPLLSLYQLLLGFSLALLVAAANVYFRDTQHIVGLLTSAWFFMSPVMYPLSMVETVAQSHPWIAQVYMLNPMTVIITAYRALQIPGVAFPWSAASIAGLLLPLVILVVAYIAFQRAERDFSDLL
jgi:lipopolysaccharide transport system permease protein